MKMKIILIQIVMAAMCASSVFGQISQGGSPMSFSHSDAFSVGAESLSDNVPEFPMNKIDDALLEELMLYNDKNNESYDFAYQFNVDIDVKERSTVDSLKDGLLYRMAISSKKAFSINLIFEKYVIPPGGKLYLYNERKDHVLGAFTDANNKSSEVLPVLPIKGSKVFIEYFEPYNASFSADLVVGKVNHDYLDVMNTVSIEDDFGASCYNQVDINCSEGDDWQDEKRAVCRMVKEGVSWCSGALINNSDKNGTPYFLTAFHCIQTQAVLDECVFIFNYESPTCKGVDGSTSQSISGGILRGNHVSSDFSLIELSKRPFVSFSPYYAGWDRETPYYGGVCIHHPQGDVKKISTYTMQPETADCFQNDPRSKYDFYRIEWAETDNGFGVTQKGSSGAPLFNSYSRIIGQLQGRCAYVPCHRPGDKVSNFGKLHRSWDKGNGPADRLRDWLNPENDLYYLDGIDGCKTGTATDWDLRTAIETGSTDFYGAQNELLASNVVESGATASYKARNRIVLKPGFHTKPGSDFSAKIDPIHCALACDQITVDQWTSNVCQGDDLCFEVDFAGSYTVKVEYSTTTIFQSSGTIYGNGNHCIWSVPSGQGVNQYTVTVVFESDCDLLSNTYTLNVISCAPQSGNYAKNDEKSSDHGDAIETIINTDELSISGIDLYPNPAKESITIEADLEIQLVRILTINGKVVQSMSGLSSKSVQVDLSDMEGGTYLMETTTESGVQTQSFQKL